MTLKQVVMASMAAALASVALGAGVEPAAGGGRGWTLKSGQVEYRLRRTDEGVVLAYFGPAGKADWAAPTGRPWVRLDVSGSAEGQALWPTDLTVVTDEVRDARAGCPQLRIVYRHKRLPLEVEAVYTAWGDTGVFSRRLTYANRGEKAMTVEAAPSLSLCLPPGAYTVEHLDGGWGEERQLNSDRVGTGRVTIVNDSGRSTQGHSAWFSLHDETAGVRYAAQLASSGNWEMSFERGRGRTTTPLDKFDVVAGMGMRFDFGGVARLGAGASLALPEVAFTAAAGDLDDVCNALHRYQRQYVVPHTSTNEPLLTSFSTWRPLMRGGTAEEVKRYADAAAELGLEAVVIDASWFGDKRGKRTRATRMYGDWEPDPVTFPKGLRDVADHVHGKGMKFGVWLEMEAACAESRVLQEHPDWLLRYNGNPIGGSRGRLYLDYGKPAVRRWAKGVFDRLVDEDKVDWLKLDYNADVGERFDPTGAGERTGLVLYEHLRNYFGMLDEVRADHPGLILENCASGGLRFDLNSIGRTHFTWASDTDDPKSSVQLVYGSTLEFAPELGLHWAAGDVPTGPRPPREEDWGRFDVRQAPGWWDFVFRVAMNGQFGVSTKLLDWPAELKERARENVALYKRLRTVIAAADVYHLTPPPRAGRDPEGWMGLEYVTADGGRGVLMAYRLGKGQARQVFRLRGLKAEASYRVSESGRVVGTFTGRQLATEGLPVELADEWRATALEFVGLP